MTHSLSVSSNKSAVNTPQVWRNDGAVIAELSLVEGESFPWKQKSTKNKALLNIVYRNTQTHLVRRINHNCFQNRAEQNVQQQQKTKEAEGGQRPLLEIRPTTATSTTQIRPTTEKQWTEGLSFSSWSFYSVIPKGEVWVDRRRMPTRSRRKVNKQTLQHLSTHDKYAPILIGYTAHHIEHTYYHTSFSPLLHAYLVRVHRKLHQTPPSRRPHC